MQIVAIMLKYLSFLHELCLFGQLSGLYYKNLRLHLSLFAHSVSVLPTSPLLDSLFLTWFGVWWVPIAGISLQLHLLQCEYGYGCQRHSQSVQQKKKTVFLLQGCKWSSLYTAIPFKLYWADGAKSALLYHRFITHSLAACAHVAPGSWSMAASLLHQQRSSSSIHTEI